METVILRALQHRNKECIGIYFTANASLNNALQKQAGARWSRSENCWLMPLDKSSYEKIKKVLGPGVIIQQEALSAYLKNKKSVSQSGRQVTVMQQNTVVKEQRIYNRALVSKANPVSSVNAHVLPTMRQHLVLKAYSLSTMRTYLGEMTQLLSMLADIPADDLKPGHLARYFVYCLEKLRLSENTLHSRINALKFYYEQVLHREKFFWEIPRPKKKFILPKLLSEVEIRRLFNSLANKKHKAMLFTAYSAGLRVSEIVHLKIADIDSTRMQIFIEKAKGKKDRCVNLSPILLDILRNYVQLYKPSIYLFESEDSGLAYAIRSVQQIFTNAKRRAGIKKEVGIHSLRHSFATHLLDKGTDIKYIKDILGHFSIKTTERYLHVSRQQLVNIISPFDDLWGNEKIDW